MTPLASITAWLLSEETRVLSASALLEGLGGQLQGHMPVWRLGTGMLTMHPEVAFVSVWWTPMGGAHEEEYGHHERQDFRESPVQMLIESGATSFRVPLDRPAQNALLERWRGDGATDYLMLSLPGQRPQVFSIATDAPGGFTEPDIALIEGLRMVLSLRLDLSLSRHITGSLLRAYLGRGAAERVLSGQYTRAVGMRMEVVVFTCDLRGFTERVDHRPLEEVLADLDGYFECVSEPWIEAGGEVLKFIGDAVLGIMPIEDPAKTGQRALTAAAESFRRLAVLDATLTDRSLRMGYVLHAGEVAYGNIGSRTRIDFTVIGSVVNETSRLEKLTKTVAPLLLSDTFVALLDDPEGLRDLGIHELRGVGRPVRLHTLLAAPGRLG